MSSDERLSDVTKYGGRSDIATQCYCLVEYKVKGKRVLSIEALPVYIGNVETLSEDKIVEYLTRMLHAENAGKSVTDIKLKYKCIRMNTKIKLDGHYYYIAGKSEGRIYLENAIELFLDYKYEKYIGKIDKAKKKGSYGDKNHLISKENNILLYDVLLHKLESNSFSQRNASIVTILKDKKETFEKKCTEEQCEVLLQVVKWLGVVCAGVDLTLIGASKTSGICRTSKKITEANELKLIFDSTTGLYEKTLDLLEL